MSRPPSPLFLQRETYRRRRLMDAARILPVAGLVLVLLPALWQRAGDPNTGAQAIYLFAVWAALILAAALLARPLRRSDAPRRPDKPKVDTTRADTTKAGIPEADRTLADAPEGDPLARPAEKAAPDARPPAPPQDRGP